MSTITATRIANVLEKQFQGLIDMADYDNRPTQKEAAFRSRALAALCIKSLADVDAPTAAKAVTDGFNDGCVDALHFDQKTDTLFLVTTKWSDKGKNAIEASEAQSFVSGVRDLLTPKFERFNERIRAKEAAIRTALYAEAGQDVKIVLVLAHMAAQPISAHAKQKVDDFLQEQNEAVQCARAVYLDQAGIYNLIITESEPQKIDLSITLRHFGFVEGPVKAFYGHVEAAEVANWWSKYGDAITWRNLRQFFRKSEVNLALRSTIANEPQNFWYFNNGITIICDTAKKKIAGSTKRDIGEFLCEGVSVVNGAQTVGTIGTTKLDPNGHDAWVQVRIIPLENCPPGFAAEITRATNFQNAVTRRDLAALDPVQHRLAMEFALDHRKYVYRSGEADPRGDAGCSIVEATTALACAHSAALTVQAKREIGELWADTGGPPYLDLFNDDLDGRAVWRAVLVLRATDDEVQRLRKSEAPRADLIGVHLKLLVLHLVFEDPEVKRAHGVSDDDGLKSAATTAARTVFPLVAQYLKDNHAGDYLAPLSKNRKKCEALVRHLLAGRQRNQGASEFDKTMRALVQVPKAEIDALAKKERSTRKKD
jgi:hypothetical protein